jgi:hypothetical protein
MLSIPLPTETIVMDENHTQLFKFEGPLCLPIGARIHIDNGVGGDNVPLDDEKFPSGHADAIVTGLRIWGTQSPRRVLILDVEVKDPGSTIWDVSELG